MTDAGRGRPAEVPDELFALVIVVTGVLILDGSAALQVVWLVVIAFVAGAGVLRRSPADPRPGRNGTPS